ncbi:hypothetical protein Y032_0013g2054 [Ancylostoma ceylanicum]|uniref:Uncharacterized protein n=1 Tax=Ancylostoma ceylanicum TaxID=53326 RepID=A0A016VD85_9BILA|nr:hypothetical protein Y032_0013g2054 [Ancylostoma ceylanicum]
MLLFPPNGKSPSWERTSPSSARRMNPKSLLAALKSEKSDHVKALLKSADTSQWPTEVLLPFTLREVLRALPNARELNYVANSFRLFSTLRRLHELQRREAAELHRLSLLAESVHTMMQYDHAGDVNKLSDFVMRRYQTVVRLYACRRYMPQFKYLVTVCHRRSRLLKFKKRSSSLLVKILDKLKRRGLNFVEALIAVMIR